MRRVTCTRLLQSVSALVLAVSCDSSANSTAPLTEATGGTGDATSTGGQPSSGGSGGGETSLGGSTSGGSMITTGGTDGDPTGGESGAGTGEGGTTSDGGSSSSGTSAGGGASKGGSGGTTGSGGKSGASSGGASKGGTGGTTGGTGKGGASSGGASKGGTTGGTGKGGNTSMGGSGGALNCTNLSGTVTTVAKGTYCVTGNVIIPEGSTLTIPAGTEFIFRGNYTFGRDPALPDDETHPSGALVAIGTAQAPIIFRGETPTTTWRGIMIYKSPTPVHVEYVTIRDTYKNHADSPQRTWWRGGGLCSHQNSAGTIVRNCQFINNRASQVSGALEINGNGFWPNTGKIEIVNTLFENNWSECLPRYAETPGGSNPDRCGGGAIRFSHVSGAPEYLTMTGNTFRNNRAVSSASFMAFGGAIGGFDSSVHIGPNNRFENNSAGYQDGAVSCAGLPQVGLVIDAIDPSNVFVGNTPNTGCGLP